MARISKTDRQLQLQHEADGQHLYANRVQVYPKAVHGPFRQVKWAILILCLGVYYLLPWLRWDRGVGRADQAVLLDLWHERFYLFGLELWLFGLELWPQDIYYLTGLLIMGAVGLFLVTSLAGRIWCGYSCPQTVWTDLFMWVEGLIEGDRNERMRRDAEPVSFDAVWRKAAKHAVWLGIAFWTGGAWIMYYVDAPTVTVEFWTGTASTEVYVFTALFTATTYLLAGWAREQVCTYMCPWPRFQSAMLDEQSFTVTYQAWRGEPRARGRREAHAELAPLSRRGDCVDCGACVTACPTGIDIRDGIQMECINCGLCVDACNHVMERTGQPPWLVAWDTLARQAAKAAGRHEPIRLLRPRTIIYASALVIAMVAMGVAFANRADDRAVGAAGPGAAVRAAGRRGRAQRLYRADRQQDRARGGFRIDCHRPAERPHRGGRGYLRAQGSGGAGGACRRCGNLPCAGHRPRVADDRLAAGGFQSPRPGER
jgi:cytochrome c oxidase accessory protein FixG